MPKSNAVKEAQQEALNIRKDYSDFRSSNNFNRFTNDIVELTNSENIEELNNNIAALVDALTKQQDAAAEGSKERSALTALTTEIKRLNDSTKGGEAANWKVNAENIKKIYKNLEKNMSLYSNTTQEQLRDFTNKTGKILDNANEALELQGKKLQTLSENMSENLQKVKKNIMDVANFLNIQKLVTGGASVDSLRTMQADFKRTMNVTNSMFMQAQGSFINANKFNSDIGFSFKDSVNYMSNISNYSMKSYNQAVAMYKQVTIGTKYLGLTSQNISELVKTQNAMADRDYMDKQMALLAALGTNSAVSENMGDLSSFISQNATALQARYGSNATGIMNDAVLLKSVSDSLLGNESSLVTNLMQELMSASDFSQLSAGTQQLLAYTGQANNVWAQMRSGNLNLSNVMQGVLSNTGNLTQYQRTNLENMGLGNWVTAGASYSRNSEEFLELLRKQYDALEGIDMSTEEGRALAQKMLGKQNNSMTWLESFQNTILNSLGLQNQSWQDLLGFVQLGTTLLNGVILGLDIRRNMLLTRIANQQAVGGAGGINGTGGSKLLSSKTLGLAGGAIMAYDAMKGYSDGGVGGALRYGVMGTGNNEQSSGDKAGSILGNAGKGALIGASIGGVPGAIIGGIGGAFLGWVGTMMDPIEENTKAIKKNTDAYKSTTDSMYSNSAISQFYNGLSAGGDSYGGFGDGDSSTYSGSYPWGVSRGFGMGWKYVNGKRTNDRAMHYGIDLTSKSGTPIGAAMSGTVSATGKNNSAGNYTIIAGDDGWTYRYFHQLTTPPVSKGDYVNVGDTIGFMGSTGNSSGTHLHFQVDKGGKSSAVNPVPFITGGLFSASGKVWSKPKTVDSTQTIATEDNKLYYLSKDAIFSSGSGAGDVPTPLGEINHNYATSQDIDRLIEVISNMKNEQEEQRSFMQALAGKNTFVFGK